MPSESELYRQDLPPKAKYEPVRYKRNLPVRGPSGWVIFAGTIAICGFGFYRLGNGTLERRELRRETLWSRHHLVPLLQAERDRDEYRREQAALAREHSIMKDVPDWEVGKSVYHTQKYVPRSIAPV